MPCLLEQPDYLRCGYGQPNDIFVLGQPRCIQGSYLVENIKILGMFLQRGSSPSANSPDTSFGKRFIGISFKFVLATIQSVTANANRVTHIAYTMTSYGFCLACKELTALTLVVCFQTLHFFIA